MNMMFGSMSTEGLEQAEDRLGGGGFILDSDIYSGTIKAMYAGASDGGAQNMTIIADLNGKEYRETVYFTNKKGENFFLNKNDPTKKVPLPGFTIVNDICLVATGAPLCEQEAEEKVVKVWDNDAKAEVPKNVPMLTAAIGKPVSFAIQKILENKSKKDSSGNYVDTPETRDTNTIQKVFDTDSKKTVVEALNGQEAGFWDAWVEKNQGKVYDKRTIRDGGDAGSSGKPGVGPQAGGAKKATKSLFDKS